MKNSHKDKHNTRKNAHSLKEMQSQHNNKEEQNDHNERHNGCQHIVSFILSDKL